jgi:membrane protease YdiL (CAAX protease family)
MLPSHIGATRSDIVLRLTLFLFAAVVLTLITPLFLPALDRVSRGLLTNFIAGLAANLISVHKFEHGQWSDFGLPRNQAALRHVTWGFVLGMGAVGLLAGGAVVAGFATFEPVPPDRPLLLVLLLLFAGALGEELLFRGYPFQYLAREWSPSVMILGSGALFGFVHLAANSNINPLGALNTALWGAVLGYAYWRTQTLWLPTGLHFGWNLGLVLIGVPLSGITMKVSGFELHWSAGTLISGGEYGPEGGLLAAVLGLAMVGVLRRGRF